MYLIVLLTLLSHLNAFKNNLTVYTTIFMQNIHWVSGNLLKIIRKKQTNMLPAYSLIYDD